MKKHSGNLVLLSILCYKEAMKLADRVYQLLLTVPAGKVTTYKQIGQALGTRGWRAIGQILRCNPNAPKVPCHRVVSSNGTLGGFMGKRTGIEIAKKTELLKSEGIQVVDNKIINFTNVLHLFS